MIANALTKLFSSLALVLSTLTIFASPNQLHVTQKEEALGASLPTYLTVFNGSSRADLKSVVVGETNCIDNPQVLNFTIGTCESKIIYIKRKFSGIAICGSSKYADPYMFNLKIYKIVNGNEILLGTLEYDWARGHASGKKFKFVPQGNLSNYKVRTPASLPKKLGAGFIDMKNRCNIAS